MVAKNQTVPRALAVAIERWWLPILAGIVIVGGVLRLVDLQLVEFRHDSAWWSYAALQLLRGGAVPLIGQPVGSVTVPLYNGPLMTYLVSALFALVGNEPLRANMFIALCNTAGIVVTFMLGRRMYSTAVGLIAALMMAIAPWLVLYSRMLWPQALYLFLVPVILYVLLVAIEKDRAWLQVLLGVLLGFGLQLHLSMLVLIGVSGLIVLAYSRRKALVVLLGLGVLIGYAPILIYDATHNFANLSVLARLPSFHAAPASEAQESRITHIVKAVWNFSNVLSGQGMWVSKLSKQPYLPRAIDWGQGILGAALFGMALLTMLVANMRGKPLRQAIKFPLADAIILLAALVPLFYMAFSSSPVQRHYFIFFYPAVFLVMARGLTLLQAMLERRPLWPPVRWAIPTALALLCVMNLMTNLYARQFVTVTGGQGEYGTVLADKEDAIRAILNRAGERFEVDLAGVQEPLPYIFLLERDVPIRYDGPPELVKRVLSAQDEGLTRRYRIIEPEYDKTAQAVEGDVIFHSRGVMVIELPE